MASIRSVGTALTALALVAALPANASAGVRPSSAVPTAASSAGSTSGGSAFTASAWPAYLVLALTLATGVWAGLNDGKGKIDVPVSRG